ncbi:complement component C8 gamma chain [Betta splendens]|uniref:Complement component C8 gamma chain n=1 Tax=Betta splendens TaxID=158456 RepID=A0A6P7MEG7_BETSP|nr:complement component C8 gamma chain [Betta splendens]
MAAVRRCIAAGVFLACMLVGGSGQAIGGAKSRPRPQRPTPKEPKVTPIDVTQPAANIDIQKMTGKWYLLNTASKCSYLMTHGTAVEPTVITLTYSPSATDTLSVSTKTRRDHQCWEVLQVYYLTQTPGRLTLKGPRPELNTEIVIGETDYTSYAVIYFQKQGKMTVKLYGRSVDNLSEPMLTKFERLADKQKFGLAYLVPFPTYSHCGDVDKDHVINCVPTC